MVPDERTLDRAIVLAGISARTSPADEPDPARALTGEFWRRFLLDHPVAPHADRADGVHCDRRSDGGGRSPGFASTSARRTARIGSGPTTWGDGREPRSPVGSVRRVTDGPHSKRGPARPTARCVHL